MGLAIHSLALAANVNALNLAPGQAAKPIEKQIPKPQAQKNGCPIFLRKIWRCLRCEKTPLIDEIKGLAKAQGIIQDNQQKIKKILKAIQSIDYSSLKSDIRRIIANMSDQERKSLLETALEEDFRSGQKLLGNHCMQLMTLSQMQSLAKSVSNEFENVQKTAKEFHEIIQNLKKYDVEEARFKLVNHSKEFILCRILKNFINTILVAFNLLELGKEPNTYFETKYLLDIYWRLLEIPVKIIKFIFNIFINPIISFAVVGVGAIISTLSIQIFQKWFKRCPDQLPYCENLTAAIKNGSIKPIYGRDEEINQVLQALAANNDESRKHPLLVGKSGIGKTEMMKSLAWRLANDNVPPALKGKKLFYINCAELIKAANGFDLKDPLEQIMDKVANYRNLIIVFDEADNLVDTLAARFNSILDTSSKKSLYYAIGITTPEKYKEKIETTSLDRRFDVLPVEEATKEQTCMMLQHMIQQRASDIKISPRVFEHIYTQTHQKVPTRCNPDKAMSVMSNAIQKIRHLQNGGDFDQKMHKLRVKRYEEVAKLAREQLNGIAINAKPIQDIKKALDVIDSDIQGIEEKIKDIKENAKAFINLKKQQKWHEEWLEKTSEKIHIDTEKGKKIPEILEKMYLFNSFIFIPQLEKYLSDFAGNLDIEITENMIDEIVNKMANKNKVEVKVNQEIPEGQDVNII